MPECGVWPEDLGKTNTDRSYYNFGCAQQQNLAAMIETGMTPMELRDWLRELEDRHGRDRSLPKYSDRTLGVDIPLFGPNFEPWVVFVLPAGGFLTLGFILLAMGYYEQRKAEQAV